MLPRSKRLSREGFEFLTHAKRVQSEHFSISYTEPNKIGGFAVVISKKVAPLSVTRHRLKRQIRAVLGLYDHDRRAVVVFVRKGVPELSFTAIENELSLLLQSILKHTPSISTSKP
jgi:ribonuclease P protein component